VCLFVVLMVCSLLPCVQSDELTASAIALGKKVKDDPDTLNNKGRRLLCPRSYSFGLVS
jgi:hypothetical protein